MNHLTLPEQLKGNWQHALFVTYGADLPFFETALWRQFAASCRNKIVLADGQHLLESFIHYAENGLARRVNHAYVAEGIFVPHAAHAKLILLTTPKRGRLLVGSGNLGWQGYASGGEVFTGYDYDAEQDDGTEKINPFLAARDFIETIRLRGYFSGDTTQNRLRYLFEQTPWLYRPAVGDWKPVRHNLTTDFLRQLQDAIGDAPVEELWIASPFYDGHVKALKRLIKTFQPRKVTLLMQPGQTSIDPTMLQNVLEQFPQCDIRAVQRRKANGESDTVYLHAKFYLFKLKKDAVCLQGSPNLSQVAMLRRAPNGNIELANLLTGMRDAFDDLLDALVIEPPTRQIETLDLRFDSSARTPPELEGAWRLTGGDLVEDHINLTCSGTNPPLAEAVLQIGGINLPATITVSDGRLECTLPAETDAKLFTNPVPVRLQWTEDGETHTSNPVFLCHKAALDAVLEVSDDTHTLPRIGDLEIEDDEIEQLLGDLQASLVFDRQSVWQTAGRTPPRTASADDDDEALHLSYADIDYEILRQHPKFSQYRTGGTGTTGQPRTRLQIILSAITDHFDEVLRPTQSGHHTLQTIVTALDAADSTAESEEEAEADAGEREHRHWSRQQRIRRILQNFITRYLRGIRSNDFREMVGHEVMAHNYIIFSHILWRLFSKEWVPHEFIINSFLQLWQDFWGFPRQDGYYFQLLPEQQSQLLVWLLDKHTPATMLATVYQADYLSRSEGWTELRMALRDFWRAMLQHAPFKWTEKTIEETWRLVGSVEAYQTPPPHAIFNTLHHLANYETEASLLRALEAEHGLSTYSCVFRTEKVYREALNRASTERCLVIAIPDALADYESALRLLRHWMRLESRDYYRLETKVNERGVAKPIIFYDRVNKLGVFWTGDSADDPVDFSQPARLSLNWDTPLAAVQALAAQVDANLLLNAEISVAA